MHDLRLVGVHDDGEHLLLSGTGGEIFRLRIDEALRVASTRTPYRSTGSRPQPAADEPALRLSPRDIQSRIRSGATAEEVAEESGLELAHIERYEGPVRAERDYIAAQAQLVHVSSPLPTHDGYRSAFGDNPASLASMVSHRVAAFGLDPESVTWDAWRRPDGAWNVLAQFEPSSETAASIGEQPPAQWTFDAARKTISNGNRWAQLLSELEPMDGPLPTRRLAAVADRVFDFEAERAGAEDEAAEEGLDSENLLDVLRSRRGQRLGADEPGDDALAMMLSQGVPAAHPREGRHEDGDNEEQDEHGEGNDEPAHTGASFFPALTLAPRYSGDDDGPHLHDGVSTRTREISISGAPRLQPADEPEPQDRVPQEGAQQDSAAGSPPSGSAPMQEAGADHHRGRAPARTKTESTPEAQDRKHIKPKRSSIPSWDEIVFGTKSD